MLGVSQPTLSAMLVKLEDELDVRIFDRTNKVVKPTSVGERIIRQAQKALMETNRIKIIPISERDEEFVRTVYLTYHKTRPLSPSAQEVCDYIIKNYAL